MSTGGEELSEVKSLPRGYTAAQGWRPLCLPLGPVRLPATPPPESFKNCGNMYVTKLRTVPMCPVSVIGTSIHTGVPPSPPPTCSTVSPCEAELLSPLNDGNLPQPWQAHFLSLTDRSGDLTQGHLWALRVWFQTTTINGAMQFPWFPSNCWAQEASIPACLGSQHPSSLSFIVSRF